MTATYTKFIRTCQECGNKQEDTEPNSEVMTIHFTNRPCKKCKSEALDYGSTRTFDAITGKELEWEGD